MLSGLFSWQEPFREFMGKKVKMHRKSGRSVTGIIMPTGRARGGKRPAIGKIAFWSESGRVHLFRVENIERVEEVGS